MKVMAKNPPANAGDVFLGREDPLEKDMANHSSTLGRRTVRTEELSGLQSPGPKELA